MKVQIDHMMQSQILGGVMELWHKSMGDANSRLLDSRSCDQSGHFYPYLVPREVCRMFFFIHLVGIRVEMIKKVKLCHIKIQKNYDT